MMIRDPKHPMTMGTLRRRDPGTLMSNLPLYKVAFSINHWLFIFVHMLPSCTLCTQNIDVLKVLWILLPHYSW